MKLATLKDGSRDGQLVVVSRDLATAHYASGIANHLQLVLDDWGFFSPQLQDLYDELNAGRSRHAFALDIAQCMAPLPRAYQCLEGTDSVVEAGSRPASTRPELHQWTGDALLGPRDALVAAHADMGIDFGAGLAVITGDIARASPPEQALDGVRLLMLANTVTLRALQQQEQADGRSPLTSRPATSFGPVAITPDELGTAWKQGRLALTLGIGLNGRKFGLCDAADGMPWGFDELIAQACTTRAVRAGTVVCSGSLRSERGGNGAADIARGHASMAAKRSADALKRPDTQTAFLQAGDTVRMEMKGADGHSLFGAIEQTVVLLVPSS